MAKTNGTRCNWHYLVSAVNANGSISPCCGIQHEAQDFGSLRERPFANVWRGDLYRGVRRLYAGNDVIGEQVRKSACAQCPVPDDQGRYDEFFVELLKRAPASIVEWAISTLPSEISKLLEADTVSTAPSPRNYYEARRWYNLVQALDERARGIDRPQSYPAAVILDPSSACSLRCPMCPVSYTPEVRQKKVLSIALFDRILEELGPYLFLVDLFNWGEPLLNKQLPEMIAKIKRYEIEIRISSSLSVPIPDSVFESMVMNGVDTVTVSIDGYSQETYEKYRVRGNLALALSNLERLVAIKNRFRSARPVIDWQYLVFSFNEDEVEVARAHAEGLGIEFRAVAPYINIHKYPDWVSTKPEYQMPLYREILEARKKADALAYHALLDVRAEGHFDSLTEGFFKWEKGVGRWMAQEGTIRVPLTRATTIVMIDGYADPANVKKPLTLSVRAGQRRIGEATIERSGPFTVRIPIDVADLEGLTTLTLEASSTFVPALSRHTSQDPRFLSVMIHKIGVGTAKRSLPLVTEAPPPSPAP